MFPVGPTAKVDAVDLPPVVHAVPAFARPPANRARAAAEPEQTPDISRIGRLKSTAAATLDAAERLTRPQTWSATKATSSDDAVVQAVSDRAKPGRYSVAVDAVATAQTTASATFSSISTVIGIGTLKIELGNWNASQTAFATNPNWPKASVTFGPKDTSLERIRDKINSAGIGVIASVVSDATGSRLVLRSTSTGSDNGFKVETEGNTPSADNGAALAALGFDPSQINKANAKPVQPAQDARIRIDGREVDSEKNLIEDEETGLSLRVNATSDSPIQIKVEPDDDAIRSDIQAFAASYNELSRQLNGFDKADADDAISAARDIQSRVQQAFARQPDDDNSMAERMRTIGVQMGKDGQMQIDPDELTRALREQPQQVERLFADEPTQRTQNQGAQAQGLARRLADIELADKPGASAPQGAARADETGATAAGAFYRQKLLEQYTPSDSSDTSDAAVPDEELAIQANEA